MPNMILPKKLHEFLFVFMSHVHTHVRVYACVCAFSVLFLFVPTGGPGAGPFDSDRADGGGRSDRHDHHDVFLVSHDRGVLGGDVGVRQREREIERARERE